VRLVQYSNDINTHVEGGLLEVLRQNNLFKEPGLAKCARRNKELRHTASRPIPFNEFSLLGRTNFSNIRCGHILRHAIELIPATPKVHKGLMHFVSGIALREIDS